MAERLRDPVPATLVALTFATGLVDAISFIGLGRVFTANMTGNVVLLGFALAGASGLSIAASLVALAAFLGGAALGGGLVRRLAGRRRRALAIALGVEVGLVAAALLAAIGVDVGEATARGDVVVGLLALAMGFRNATVRRHGVPDLTTTVLTMTLTGLAADSAAEGGRAAAPRRIASAAAMFLGALAGAAAVLHGHLLVALGILLGIVVAIAVAYAIRGDAAPAGAAAA